MRGDGTWRARLRHAWLVLRGRGPGRHRLGARPVLSAVETVPLSEFTRLLELLARLSEFPEVSDARKAALVRRELHRIALHDADADVLPMLVIRQGEYTGRLAQALRAAAGDDAVAAALTGRPS